MRTFYWVLWGTVLVGYARQAAKANYLNRVELVRKIRERKQKTDIGKYSFVNRTIKNWNQPPAEALGTFPCKPKIFRKRVRKANISRMKQKD